MPVVTNSCASNAGAGAHGGGAAASRKNKAQRGGGCGGGSRRSSSSFTHRDRGGRSSSWSSSSTSSWPRSSRPIPPPPRRRGRNVHRHHHYYTVGAVVAVLYVCANIVLLREMGGLLHHGGESDSHHHGRRRGGIITRRADVITTGNEYDVVVDGSDEGMSPHHKPNFSGEGAIEDAEEGEVAKSSVGDDGLLSEEAPHHRGDGGDHRRGGGPTSLRGGEERPSIERRRTAGGGHGADEGGGGEAADYSVVSDNNNDFKKEIFDVFPRPYQMNCSTDHRSYLDDLILTGITFRRSGTNGDTDEGRGERELRGLFERSIRPDIFLHSTSTSSVTSDAQTAAVVRITIQVDEYNPTLDGAHEGYVLQFPPADVDLMLRSSAEDSEGGGEGSSSGGGVVVSIRARTQVGVIRAFETLTQLIHFDFSVERYVMPTDCTIRDVPRFRHRGLLIDVARHHLPIPQLRRIVDQLRMNKLSVLHLHLTDDQSFPFSSGWYPEVSRLGAKSEVERYTKADLRGLVEYARVNGVRVIAELDQPGHVGSLYHSHPELFACKVEAVGGDIKNVALDPTDPIVYDFMVNLTLEVMDVFRDAYFHMGTDEIPVKCWENLTMEHDVDADVMFRWYVSNMTDRLASPAARVTSSSGRNATTGTTTATRRRIILWDEALMAGAAVAGGGGGGNNGGGNGGRGGVGGHTIQVWRNTQLIRIALKQGYEVIASPSSGGKSWYLDNEEAWWDRYQFDPMDRVPSEYGHLLLGGEGCMWGERVDSSNFESRVWPAMSAIAEKLWSDGRYTMRWRKHGDQQKAPPTGLFYREVSGRLGMFRCHLVQRGVHASPPGGNGSTVNIGDRCDAAFPSVARGPRIPERNPWSNWNDISNNKSSSAQSLLNQTAKNPLERDHPLAFGSKTINITLPSGNIQAHPNATNSTFLLRRQDQVRNITSDKKWYFVRRGGSIHRKKPAS